MSLHTPQHFCYSHYIDSINGINREISRKRNYLNAIKTRVARNKQSPEEFRIGLKLNKEIIKLTIIRNQIWIIILTQEINEEINNCRKI